MMADVALTACVSLSWAESDLFVTVSLKMWSLTEIIQGFKVRMLCGCGH